MNDRQDTNGETLARFRGSTPADLLVLCGLTGLWIVLVLVVNPRGDFPILDDWSYGRTVKILIEERRLFYDGWNAPTLFLQVLYGAIFCLPFGFSFDALRISTLVAGLAGVWGTYLLLREASANRLLASVGSLVLLLNPSYFQHAFTFMTDVPFTALLVISAVFFLRALRTDARCDIVWGTVFASCATLVRQPGIAVAVAYGLALVVKSSVGKRASLRSGLPALVTLLVYVIYDRVIEHLQVKPILLGTFLELPLTRVKTEGWPIVTDTIRRGEAAFAHMSVLVLPFLLVLLGQRSRHQLAPRHKWSCILSILGLSTILCLRFWPPDLPLEIFFPMHTVMVGDVGWGPTGVHHRFRPGLWLLEFVSTALMTLLLAAVILRIRRIRDERHTDHLSMALFGVSASLMLIAPFLLGHFYERYLIPLLPFIMLSLAALTTGSRQATTRAWQVQMTVAGIVLLVLFGAVAVLFAHDHLVWNRVRWQAVNFLVNEKGIDPARIDGGLSVSGWYLFPAEGPLRRRYANSAFERGQWWRNDAAEYIIALSNPTLLEFRVSQARRAADESLDTVWTKSFEGWLPGADGDVLVCRGALCQEIFRQN